MWTRNCFRAAASPSTFSSLASGVSHAIGSYLDRGYPTAKPSTTSKYHRGRHIGLYEGGCLRPSPDAAPASFGCRLEDWDALVQPPLPIGHLRGDPDVAEEPGAGSCADHEANDRDSLEGFPLRDVDAHLLG